MSIQPGVSRVPSVVLRRGWAKIVLTSNRTNVDKVNAELVTLTYGTMVAQLCSDFNHKYGEVNQQLDKMGYNIGMRLIEDFFAKSGVQRCGNLRETAETISKVCCSSHAVLRVADCPYCPETEIRTDRIQDVPQHHPYGVQLVGRQQVILANL